MAMLCREVNASKCSIDYSSISRRVSCLQLPKMSWHLLLPENITRPQSTIGTALWCTTTDEMASAASREHYKASINNQNNTTRHGEAVNGSRVTSYITLNTQ